MTTQTWITGTSGDWSTAADWVSGVVPSATDDAVINNSSAVTVNGTAVAYSLTLDHSTLTDIGTITLGTSLTVDGGSYFILSGGTLSAQSITSGNEGDLSGYGTVSGAVSGYFGIDASGGTLKVQGSLAADQGYFWIYGGATLELSNGTAEPVYFQGSTATLRLDAPTAFTGSISNIVLGDTIDLAGIQANSASYNGWALTINETNGQQLTFNNVSGSVAGDIVTVASDNNGGTLVYWTQPLTIDHGATLELSVATSQDVNFLQYYFESVATLKLDAPTTFTGQIENIAVGDIIDLVGITATTASYNGSTLTINETNGQHLTYMVSGSVAGDIPTVSSDNNGGTNISWVPPPESWINVTIGDWSTAADWLSGVSPTSTNDAVINNVMLSFFNEATVDGTAVAHSLTLNNSVLTVSGNLTLGTSLTLDGSSELNLSGGSLSAQSIVSENGNNGEFEPGPGGGSSSISPPPSLPDGELSGYGTINISGPVSGDVDIFANGGLLKVQGSLTGDQGIFYIDQGATLELSNGSSLPVNYYYTLGTLKLDAPTTFTGQIENITAGDVIDLVGITATSASYNRSTLTINETNGQQLTYAVSGSIAGDILTVSSDNNGGTNISWVPPPESWITRTSGDWSQAADWLSGLVPSATDDAVVNNTPYYPPGNNGTQTISVGGTAVAHSLTLNNSAILVSGTLTLDTSLTLTGTFPTGSTTLPFGAPEVVLSGGTLSAQTIDCEFGSTSRIYGYGTINISGPVSGDVDIFADGGLLKVQGSLTGDQGIFGIGPGPALEFSNGAATLELSNGSSLPVSFYYTPGTLKLDAPTAFTGQIENITVGDMIDLVGIKANSAIYNGSTLTINETNGHQLTYAVVNSSVAGDTLTISNDNNGGIDIYWSARPSPTVAITSTGGLTNHPTQTVSGTVGVTDAGTIVSILDGTTVLGATVVNSNGSWSDTITLTGDGTHTVTAQDIDNTGAIGTSNAVTYTLDTTPPVVAITSAGGQVNNPTQIVSGTVDVADVGTLVTLYDSTTEIGTTTVQANGSWSDSITLTGNGSNTVTAQDTDAAGNTGTSNSVVYNLNTVAPITLPTVEQVTATVNNHASIVTAGNVVTITVNVSEPVTVVGIPALLLNDSEAALYTGGSGTSTLTFEYAVQPSDSISDLTVAGLYLSPGASIHDVSNNPLMTVTGDLALQVNASLPSTTTATYEYTPLNFPSIQSILGFGSSGPTTGGSQINNLGQVIENWSFAANEFSVYGGSFLYSDGNYTTVAYPPNKPISTSPLVISAAINDQGQIVGSSGSYQFPASNGGFLLSNGVYQAINYPSSNSTDPTAINNSGQIVGAYFDSSFQKHWFLYSSGTYVNIDGLASQGITNSSFVGINDSGDIIGNHQITSTGVSNGFVSIAGNYTVISDPVGTSTAVVGINNLDQIIGNYSVSANNLFPVFPNKPFLYSNDTYITLDDPSAQSGTTSVVAINNIGQIIGNYVDANGIFQGFLYSGGNYTTIENPLGTEGTFLSGINDLGQIVGSYTDSSGNHQFIATPPAPQPTTIRQEIDGLYAAVYDRAADSFGMQYWVNVVARQADALGITYSAAANTAISTNDAALLGQLFVSTQSAYFNQTYGNLNDTGFVNALYFNMGGQNAESASSIAYWVNTIQNEEASGLSVQNARAAVVGQFVHDLIDVNLAQWTTILTPSELETTILRQAVVDNKLAVSLAYLNASAGLGGSILNAHAVGDAGFQAEVRALSGVAIDPSTATVQITGISNAVANQTLADIQPV